MEIFWFDQKTFDLFGKKFEQSYQNCSLRVQVKFMGESLRKYITVFHFFNHGQKNLNFLWKLFHSPSKLYLTCTRQQCDEKYVFRVNRINTFFGVLVKNFPRGSAEYHSTCSQPFFGFLTIFWWKACIYNFFGLWAKNFRSVEKKLDGLSELHA